MPNVKRNANPVAPPQVFRNISVIIPPADEAIAATKTATPPTPTPMSLREAADELSQLAYDFHNDMLRKGIKGLSAEEWLEEFRHWLPSGRTFAEKHERLIQWLGEVDRAGR